MTGDRFLRPTSLSLSAPYLGKPIRKPRCFLFWHQWEVQTTQAQALTPAPFHNYHKTPTHLSFIALFQAIFGPWEAYPALARESHYVSNKNFHILFACVYMASSVLTPRTGFWVGVVYFLWGVHSRQEGEDWAKNDKDLGFWMLGCLCQLLITLQCSWKQGMQKAGLSKCPSFITMRLWHQTSAWSTSHMAMPPWTTPFCQGWRQLSTKNQDMLSFWASSSLNHTQISSIPIRILRAY